MTKTVKMNGKSDQDTPAPMQKGPTIPAPFVLGALAGFAQQQSTASAVQKLVGQLGINWEMLTSPRGRISGEEFARLIKALWLHMEDEFIGFGEQPVQPGSFALMCQLAIGASTLKQALVRCLRFQNLTHITPRLVLEEISPGLSLIGFRQTTTDLNHAFIFESLLVIYHRFCSWLVDQAIPINRVSIHYTEPSHAAHYSLLFTAKTEFSQPVTGLVIDSTHLALPVVKDNLQLEQFLKEAPFSILFRPKETKSYAARIRTILEQHTGESLPKFETIAQELYVTPQTLRRRLRQEGITFNELKEHYRRDLAIHLLTRRDLAIKDVGAMLGFAEPSAFQRAFKQWTGVTPFCYKTEQEE